MQVLQIVFIIEEHLLFPVVTLGDVVRISGRYDCCNSCPVNFPDILRILLSRNKYGVPRCIGVQHVAADLGTRLPFVADNVRLFVDYDMA